MTISKQHHNHNPQFIHHQKPINSSLIREGVFGMEDGMVSTFGAITGIAAATGDQFTIILSGLVIISVESISMAVGSYLSSKSERSIDERKLQEEKIELKHYPEEERKELIEMYMKDGWPKELAETMADTASQNKQLFLKEMAYHELKIIPGELESPKQNALSMGVAYIVGGAIPLVPYLLLPTTSAIVVSLFSALCGLFLLGTFTTKFSRRAWWKAGFEMLILGGLAGAIGYVVGTVVELFWLKK